MQAPQAHVEYERPEGDARRDENREVAAEFVGEGEVAWWKRTVRVKDTVDGCEIHQLMVYPMISRVSTKVVQDFATILGFLKFGSLGKDFFRRICSFDKNRDIPSWFISGCSFSLKTNWRVMGFDIADWIHRLKTA